MVCNWILRKSPEFMGITLAFSAMGAPFPSHTLRLSTLLILLPGGNHYQKQVFQVDT